jgi:flagellin
MQVSRSSTQIASGSRINSAADDAAGLAISAKMQAQIGGTNMAVRNALDGISMIQTAEGGLHATHDMLGRVQMLSVQAANGTLNDTQRGFIQMEIDQLMSEINRVSSSTNFNGIKLLDGSLSARNGGLNLQIGARSGQQLNVSINSMSASALGMRGVNVLTQGNAVNAIGSSKNAISLVSGERASLGAMQNRLEHTVSSLINSNENMIAAQSRIADTDMASAIIENTKGRLLQQVAVSMLAHSLQGSQGVLGLLNPPAVSFRG